MSNDGVGKIKQKKSHGSAKPYDRRRSFLGRVSDTVRDILSPSWLIDAVSSAKSTPHIPQQVSTSTNTNEYPQFNRGNDLSAVPSTSQMKQVPSATTSLSAIPSSFLNHQKLNQFSTGNFTTYQSHNLDPFKTQVASTSRAPEIDISQQFNTTDQPDTSNSFLYQRSSQFTEEPITKSSALGRSQEVIDLQNGPRNIPTPFRTPGPNFKSSLFTPFRKTDHDDSIGSMNSSFGETSRLSPYYPGKTVYGGSSAHRKTRLQPNSPYQVAMPIKRATARPTRKSSNSVTSSTARKILNTLESMSSVLQDAKKIPTYSPANTSSAFSASSYRSKHTPYKDLGPPVNRLNISTPASHAKMWHPPTSEKIIFKETPSQPPSKGTSGKMRREKGSHYSAKRLEEEDEEIEVPDLPTSFTLPVTTSIQLNIGTPFQQNKSSDPPKCPPFTFSTPIDKSTPSSSTKKSTDTTVDFKFSTPIHVEKENGNKSMTDSSIASTNIDKFMFGAKAKSVLSPISSEAPVVMKSGSVLDVLKKTGSSTVGTNSFKPATELKKGGVMDILKKGSDNNLFGKKPAQEIKTSGSVMDILGGGSKSDTQKSPLKTSIRDKFKKPEGSWECTTCMIVNKSTDGKCIACDTSKPQQSDSTTTTSINSLFKPAVGSWECTTCLIVNKSSDSKCVACQTSKNSSSTSSNSLPKTTNSDTSFANRFKPPSTNWECESCMVSNTADAKKCIACQSAKPSASVKTLASGTLFKQNTDNKWECSTCMLMNDLNKMKCVACEASKPRTLPPLTTQFKPSAGNWECSTCLLQNKSNSEKCIACETRKPGANTSSQKWECPTCLINNESTATKCVACETANPSKPAAQIGFGDRFKPASNSWECGTCLVNNKPGTDRCVACSTPKAGTQITSGFTKPAGGPLQFKTASPFSQFTAKSDTIKSDFPAAPATSGFAFKSSLITKSKETDQPNTATSSGFKLPTTSTSELKSVGFSFSAGSDSINKPAEGGFKFIAPVSTTDTTTKTTAESTGFKLSEPSNSKISSLGDSVKTTTGGFSFGNTDSKINLSSAPVFGATETKVLPGIFSSNNTSSSVSSTSSLFTFGVPKDTSTPSITGSKPLVSGGFGGGNPLLTGGIKAAAQTEFKPVSIGGLGSSTTSPGQKRKVDADDEPVTKKLGTGFQYSSAPTPAPALTTGGFSFGVPTASSTTTADKPAPSSGIFAFGAPATNTLNTSSKPSTGFSGLGSTGQSPFVFGATSTTSGTSSATPAAPAFGSANQSNIFNQSSPAPAFGLAAPVSFGNNAPPSFGSSVTSAASTASTAIAFGSATPAFGQSNTPAFGQQASVPSFGSSSQSTPFGATAPSFGSVAPTFGSQPTNTGFSAPSQPGTQASVFQFGAPQPTAQPAAAPTNTGFDFSAAAQQPAGSAGFNFGAASAAPSGFNFTGSAAPASFAFNATPGANGPAAPPQARRIKKAVRKLRK